MASSFLDQARGSGINKSVQAFPWVMPSTQGVYGATGGLMAPQSVAPALTPTTDANVSQEASSGLADLLAAQDKYTFADNANAFAPNAPNAYEQYTSMNATGGVSASRNATGGISYARPTGASGLDGSRGTGMLGLQQGFSDKLGAMFAAAKAAGFHVGMTDGWRSFASQVDLKRRKGNMAATPGHSNHGWGLASDLSGATAALNWMHNNAAAYGLRFPMSYEPWHIEPGNIATGGKGTPISQFTAQSSRPTATRPASRPAARPAPTPVQAQRSSHQTLR